MTSTSDSIIALPELQLVDDLLAKLDELEARLRAIGIALDRAGIHD